MLISGTMITVPEISAGFSVAINFSSAIIEVYSVPCAPATKVSRRDPDDMNSFVHRSLGKGRFTRKICCTTGNDGHHFSTGITLLYKP